MGAAATGVKGGFMVGLSSLVLLITLFFTPLTAKDKNKSTLPDDVLRATTVRVVIHPDAGEPLEQPMANATARDSVEKALLQWGRLRPVLDGGESDLVIAVRTGNGSAVRRTIKGGPIDNRDGVAQAIDGGIRVGGQRGQPPPLEDPGMGGQNGPHVSNEVGPSEDSFEVYRGGMQHPLDYPPVWRYIAKDCLRAPTVSAVEEFRKAMAQAAKPQASKKP
jgi:hypothetical protein